MRTTLSVSFIRRLVRGQPVHIRHGHNSGWINAIVLQVNDGGKSCDVLYEDEEIELNVDCALIRTTAEMDKESAAASQETNGSIVAAKSNNALVGESDSVSGGKVHHLGISDFFKSPRVSDVGDDDKALRHSFFRSDAENDSDKNDSDKNDSDKNDSDKNDSDKNDAPRVTMMSASSLAIRAADSVWSPVFSAGSVGTRGSIQMSRTIGLPTFGAAASSGGGGEESGTSPRRLRWTGEFSSFVLFSVVVVVVVPRRSSSIR
jgi:hypothetical protein